MVNLDKNDQIKLQEGIVQLLDYKEDQAIEALVDLYKNTTDPEIKTNTGILLFHNLFWTDGFDKIHDLELTACYESNPAYGQVSNLYYKHKKSHTFVDDEISFESDYSITGTPMINVSIKGKTYKVWLDLGASISVLSEDVIKACGMEKQIINKSPNLEEGLEYLVVDEFQIANLKVKNNAFIVLPSEYSKIPLVDSDECIEMHGVIGWDIIKYFDLSIDYANKTFIFRKPHVSQSKDKNLFFDAFLLVKTDYINKELIMSFDLDKEKTSMTEFFFRDNGVEVEEGPVEVMTYEGPMEIEASFAEFLTLGIDGEAVELEKIWNTAINPCEIYSADGVLASDILTQKVLNIDVTNRHMSIL